MSASICIPRDSQQYYPTVQQKYIAHIMTGVQKCMTGQTEEIPACCGSQSSALPKSQVGAEQRYSIGKSVTVCGLIMHSPSFLSSNSFLELSHGEWTQNYCERQQKCGGCER